MRCQLHLLKGAQAERPDPTTYYPSPPRRAVWVRGGGGKGVAESKPKSTGSSCFPGDQAENRIPHTAPPRALDLLCPSWVNSSPLALEVLLTCSLSKKTGGPRKAWMQRPALLGEQPAGRSQATTWGHRHPPTFPIHRSEPQLAQAGPHGAAAWAPRLGSPGCIAFISCHVVPKARYLCPPSV